MKVVLQVIGLQIAITLLTALLFFYKSNEAALSALIGGSIGFIPSAIYMFYVRGKKIVTPQHLLLAWHMTGFFKFALILFVATLVLIKGIVIFPLILTYILTLLAYWFVLMLFDSRVKT